MIVKFENLKIKYIVKEGDINVVDDVTFGVKEGKITALIGESGSGKSTLVNAILGVNAPNAKIIENSKIIFKGKNLLDFSPGEMRKFRWQKASMVFQAAQNALNPTLKIRDQLLDTVFDHDERANKKKTLEKAGRLLEMVRLMPDRILDAYPHELSGGMRQRVIIAMALMLDPEFIILDEPTTALDVITQSYIFNLLEEIHKKVGLTMFFITHDVSAVARLAHNIIVMYAGKVFEIASAGVLFRSPGHPYTQGLLQAIPSIEGDVISRKPVPGAPPDLLHKPPGCVFHPRCYMAENICSRKEPELVNTGDGHLVACHRWKDAGKVIAT
ncbi:MAG: ABC transporter ATP-binding protein [Candidatus Eremiobacteraeota bacterium]|nr:ABC transporter ATP-binding protein [Candidatus Eremiobacteraeota bacterium]